MIGHYAPLWFDMMLIMNTIQDIYQSDIYIPIFFKSDINNLSYHPDTDGSLNVIGLTAYRRQLNRVIGMSQIRQL